jgi:hypothetical protein
MSEMQPSILMITLCSYGKLALVNPNVRCKLPLTFHFLTLTNAAFETLTITANWTGWIRFSLDNEAVEFIF